MSERCRQDAYWVDMRLAQREGFEPPCPKGQTVFKTAAVRPLCYLCKQDPPQGRIREPLLHMADRREPPTGIEPALPAWEAGVLPLYYEDKLVLISALSAAGRVPNPNLQLSAGAFPVSYPRQAAGNLAGPFLCFQTKDIHIKMHTNTAFDHHAPYTRRVITLLCRQV